MTVNKAIIVGRVGKDPELRSLPNGDAVASLSLATSERWKDKNTGEKRESTEWHRVNFFGRIAEVVNEYVRTGDLIYVEGSIGTRKWTDKDGIERYSTEIRASEMKMLSSKREAGEERPASPAPRGGSAPRTAAPRTAPAPKASSGFDDMDDDIPL